MEVAVPWVSAEMGVPIAAAVAAEAELPLEPEASRGPLDLREVAVVAEDLGPATDRCKARTAPLRAMPARPMDRAWVETSTKMASVGAR